LDNEFAQQKGTHSKNLVSKLAHLMKDTKSSAYRNANVSKLLPVDTPDRSFEIDQDRNSSSKKKIKAKRAKFSPSRTMGQMRKRSPKKSPQKHEIENYGDIMMFQNLNFYGDEEECHF